MGPLELVIIAVVVVAMVGFGISWLANRSLGTDGKQATTSRPGTGPPVEEPIEPARLTRCSDCGAEVSMRAQACPKCGAPTFTKVDIRGAWCPNCRNRNSEKTTAGGCLVLVLAVLSLGLALLALPFLPKTWRCKVCEHRWRA